MDDKKIYISDDNLSIQRTIEKCINCGVCFNICPMKDEIKSGKSDACLGCGKCIMNCPMGALSSKYVYNKVLDEINDKGKTVVVTVAPAVRVSLGDGFGYEVGTNIDKKLVTALKKIGFNYVFDTTFGADLTVMEEAAELIERINNDRNLPMFTSCCPGWVKYAEMKYPEIIPNLSTTKSPIGMSGAMIKSYFADKFNIDKDNLVVVSLAPCTAKKQEFENDKNIDYVITTSELILMLKENNIDLENLEDSNYDDMFKTGSGAGLIFGKTGGVMESTLRTAYYYLTNEKLDINKVNFEILEEYDDIKIASIKIKKNTINIAVINGIMNIDKFINEMNNKNIKFHFVEVMACNGGCINGGGGPLIPIKDTKKVSEERIKGLKEIDINSNIRFSYENPDIINVYKDYLYKPLSKKSHELLHRTYQDKSYIIKNNKKEVEI